jgi:hypothetical protein
LSTESVEKERKERQERKERKEGVLTLFASLESVALASANSVEARKGRKR